MAFTIHDSSSKSKGSQPETIEFKANDLDNHGRVAKNIKIALQKNLVENKNCKTEDEFHIFDGTREYKIRRFNDVYIVKPCSLKTNSGEITGFSTAYCNSKLISFKEKTDEHVKSLVVPKEPKNHNSTNKSTAQQRSQSVNTVKPESKGSLASTISRESSNISKTSIRSVHVKSTWKENSILNQRSRDFFNLVNQAVKLQKVFSIGNQQRRAFPSIRDALKTRGWVEKCSAEMLAEEKAIHSKIAETTIRLLKDAPVNFVWVINSIDFGTVKDETIVSRFPKNSHFTTKVGLCNFLEEFYWFYEPNLSKTISPRTFKIGTGDDIDNFIKEFGLTACVSLLKKVIDEVVSAESDKFFKNGEVPISIVDFANAQCSEYILHRSHDDIDRQQDHQVTAKEWFDFLFWFYKIVHEKHTFQTTSYPMIQALYTMSKLSLKNIEPFWPMLALEGSRNLWVVKPSAQFCGRGVRVMRNLEDIINHLDVPADSKVYRHIVQKYIEHPLLIYNTKFDIRQWFLITSVYPLTVWIYKECYLRFSSQPFLLDDLHESIHLTNNAIQRNYSNNSARHHSLPPENMWHCSTFQDYLKEIGEPEKWSSVILPGIKEGFVGAALASQDEMIDRQNSFELYGADFLLGKDYTPILLEINMGPSMAPSTSITADLCKRGLQDIIKVVLDRRHNPNADTGNFELLYKQEMGPRQHHIGLDLVVNGSKITPERKPKQS